VFLSFLLLQSSEAARFVEGDLILVRVGNASVFQSNVTGQVFIEEYTTTGDFRQALPMVSGGCFFSFCVVEFS
jgi:hypothetical protein